MKQVAGRDGLVIFWAALGLLWLALLVAAMVIGRGWWLQATAILGIVTAAMNIRTRWVAEPGKKLSLFRHNEGR